jgi:hypothetical protein
LPSEPIGIPFATFHRLVLGYWAAPADFGFLSLGRSPRAICSGPRFIPRFIAVVGTAPDWVAWRVLGTRWSSRLAWFF